MIVAAFLKNKFSAFPSTWTRLNDDTQKGAEGLAQELGDKGHIIIISSDEGTPVACSGVLPFRGENWINDIDHKSDVELAKGEIAGTGGGTSAPQTENQIVDWETCCFCIHPSARGLGISHQLLDTLVAFIKPKGAKRLMSNYSVEETGEFWAKLGFEVVPGAGGVWPKGFKIDQEKEGLREDVHFKMGAKRL